ncbi:MAG: prepilin-type N-terminal cleavage/methylation domain-containing protein [Candidatus Omnitrophica bacterium]|nr:prepilin-type N-terminal cleavage/methylation domain-containing protein [Candidatus Omnitrophota bacterium]
MKREKAYTMIEIVMVIVIVGIIAAAASANYMNSFDKAADQEASSKLSTIIAADEIYHTNSGNYHISAGPASLSTTTAMNTTLRMQLTVTNTRNWDYMIIDKTGATPPAVCAIAVRLKNGVATGACWKLCTDSPTLEKACN